MDYLDTFIILLHLLQACIHVMCGYMINPLEQNIIKSSLYSSPGFMKYQSPFSWKKQFMPAAYHHPGYSYFPYHQPQQAMYTNHHYSYLPYHMMMGRNPRHYANQLQQPWYINPPVYPTKQVIITHKPLRPTMAMLTASTKKVHKFYKMTPITHMTLPTMSSAATSKQPFTPAWLHANIRKALSPSMTYRAIERNYSVLNTSTPSSVKIYREPVPSIKVFKTMKEKTKAIDKEGQESKKYYNYITSNQEPRHLKPTFIKEESVYGNHSTWNTDSLYKDNNWMNYTTSDRTHFKDSDWRPLNVQQDTDLVLLNGIHRKPVTFAEVVSHSPFTLSDVITKPSSTTDFFDDFFNDLTSTSSTTESPSFIPKAKVRLVEPDFPEQIEKPVSIDDDFDYFDEPFTSSSTTSSTSSSTTSTSTSTSSTTTNPPSTTTRTTTKRTTTTTTPSTSTTTTTRQTTSTPVSSTTQSTTREVNRGRGRPQRRPQPWDFSEIPKSVTPLFKPLPTTSKRETITTPKSSFFSFFDMFLDHGEPTTMQPQVQKTLTTHKVSALDFFTTTISPFVRSLGGSHTTTTESAFARIFGATSPKPKLVTTSSKSPFVFTTRPSPGLFFFPQHQKNLSSYRGLTTSNTQTMKPLKRTKDGKKLMKKPRRRKTTTTSTTTTTSATTLENTKKYLKSHSKRFRNMTMNLNFMKNKATTTSSSTTTTTTTVIPPTGTFEETTFSFDKMTTTVGGSFNIETMLPTSGIPRRSVNPSHSHTQSSSSTSTTTTSSSTSEKSPQRSRGVRIKVPSSPSPPSRRIRPTESTRSTTTTSSTQAPMFQLKPRGNRRKVSTYSDTSSTTMATVSLNSVRDRDIRKVEKKFETSIMKIAQGQRKTRNQARRKIDKVNPKMYRSSEASNEVSHLPIEAFFPDVV